jgi:parallel beta-helix repeat protein
MSIFRVALIAGALGAAACGGSDEPCTGPNGPCVEIAPGPNVQEEAQTALINATAGDVIFFEAGTYEFTQGLSLDVAGVTIRGRGMDRTTLSFAGQTDGAEGLLVTADDFTIEDIAVEDTAGDAVKVEGATGVKFLRMRVEWTGGPDASNGAYGIYPVQCSNVLIDGSVAIGASDAGIYVGQSNNIIVRNSRAEFNVAGIEIENSSDADVYGNTATNNTGGFLVFNLPGLQVPRGDRTRVFDNDFYGNNTRNFAPPGNIVAKVPTGTGIAALAAHTIEIFDNRIRDNETINLGVISYHTTELEFDDPSYDAYADTLYIHDNTFSGGGTEPTDELGFLVVQGLSTIMDAPIIVPDIVIDGWKNPDLVVNGELPADKKICIQNNGDADFADLDRANDFAAVSTDLAPHDCAHTPLPKVTIPGVE